MYKILIAILFFLGFCYSESQACEWWNRKQTVVVVQPQQVVQVQYPVIVYQPVVVQEVRLQPVVENRVIYQPVVVPVTYPWIRYNY